MNRLLDAADRYEGRFKMTFRRSAREGQRRMAVGRLAKAFQTRDRAGVERIALMGVQGMQKALDTSLPPVIMAVVSAGADVAARTLARDIKKIKTFKRGVPKITFRFDRTNPSAVAWVEKHSAELVTEVTDATRTAVRKIITRAFVEGLPPRQSAELLRKIVGLHSKDEEAIANLRQRIIESPGQRIYAGKIPIRVPEKGMTKARMRQVLSSYGDRLLKRRTLLIARTETIRGSNEGQNQLWHQAIDAGKLSRNVNRVWIATPDDRVCPICEALEGKTARINGVFDGKYDGPPAHPGCRCTTGLT